MCAVLPLVIFLAAMVIIGVWGMRKTSTIGDFFLGGRTIGPWFSAFAYGTSYFSAVIFIGFAGKIGWGFGLGGLWIALGNAFIGSLLAWMVLGKRTRRMTQNLDVMTMPEFLHERFQGRYIKMIAAMIIFVFLIPYSASVFKGLGHLFQANFNIPYDTALFIMILITGVYLILGGYFAVTLTDFIQGIIMLFGALMMVGILINKAGGYPNVISEIIARYPQHVPLAKQPNIWLLVSLVFMTSFGTWGMPQMVQKFYAIKDEKRIYKAAIVTTIFALVITFAAYFTGAMAHIFYDKLPIVNGKPAFDMIIPDLLTTHMPGWLMVIILLLVLSASMSTLSSLVLVSASAVSIDLYKGHVNPRISKENSLLMIRFLSGIFVVFSYFIARYDFAVIVTLMSLSWGAVAGSFMAPFIYGLYWKRTTRLGVKAGMSSGLIIAVSLFFILGPDKSPISATIAMIVPFFVVPLFSLCSNPPDKRLVEKAFSGIS
ncbi:MAG: sodium/solute symporter [Candidatus Omnitrophica bacterium]|jgi:SSS family solute:Na+ symporter|nr:sodium/solute symporter [Candidatus Omnitrophota bacterium]MDD5079348.1 sodium/solute symporter [Candidatus Omnitrophota bacterium]